jgi:hypothetical protein
MRRIIIGATLFLSVTTVLVVVQSALARSSGGSEQVVFATANGPTDFNYVTPTPPRPDAHFGFWIWCEGPAASNGYVGDCNGSMYFYVFGITRPVKGTVSGSGGVFTMNVWSTDSATSPTIACSLTNGTAFTGNGSERQTISVNCPGDTGKSPTVTGSGTANEAVVNIVGQ